jgi:hypothetical protein
MPPAGVPQSAGDNANDFAVETIEVTSLDGRSSKPRRPRRPPPRALTLAATVAVVLAVAVGIFVRTATNPAAAVATLLLMSTATPQPTFVPGANIVYFSNGAPWGVLTIDGRRMPSPDVLGAMVEVSAGTHTLTYQARYFPSVHCTFSAPARPSDTCPKDQSQEASQFILDQGLGRVLDLGSTGATLQQDQLTALISLANAQLAGQAKTAPIQPGDRYLDANGQIVTASAPLRFTLTLSLDQSETSSLPTSACFQFCPHSSFTTGGQLSNQQWPMRVSILAAWAITDANGAALTPSDYLARQQIQLPILDDMGVQLTPDGWKVTEAMDVSVQATQQTAALVLEQAAVSNSSTSGFSISFIIGKNPLNGCVMDVAVGGDTARLFWRFGVLLAVGTSSQTDFPQVPLANYSEGVAAKYVDSYDGQK